MRTEQEVKKHRDNLRRCKGVDDLSKRQLDDLSVMDNLLTWVLEEDGGKIDSAVEEIASVASEVAP